MAQKSFPLSDLHSHLYLQRNLFSLLHSLYYDSWLKCWRTDAVLVKVKSLANFTILQLWTGPISQAWTDSGPQPQSTPDPVTDCHRLNFPPLLLLKVWDPEASTLPASLLEMQNPRFYLKSNSGVSYIQLGAQHHLNIQILSQLPSVEK